jgi:hypothetical protein
MDPLKRTPREVSSDKTRSMGSSTVNPRTTEPRSPGEGVRGVFGWMAITRRPVSTVAKLLPKRFVSLSPNVLV